MVLVKNLRKDDIFLDFGGILNEAFGIDKEILFLKEMLKSKIMMDEIFYEYYIANFTKNMNSMSPHLRKRDNLPYYNEITEIKRGWDNKMKTIEDH